MLAVLAVIVAINLIPNRDYRPTIAFLAQQNSNMISGHVTDNQHNSIPDLRVELLNEVDTVIQVVKTNGSGLFVFRKLSDGTSISEFRLQRRVTSVKRDALSWQGRSASVLLPKK